MYFETRFEMRKYKNVFEFSVVRWIGVRGEVASALGHFAEGVRIPIIELILRGLEEIQLRESRGAENVRNDILRSGFLQRLRQLRKRLIFYLHAYQKTVYVRKFRFVSVYCVYVSCRPASNFPNTV